MANAIERGKRGGPGATRGGCLALLGGYGQIPYAADLGCTTAGQWTIGGWVRFLSDDDAMIVSQANYRGDYTGDSAFWLNAHSYLTPRRLACASAAGPVDVDPGHLWTGPEGRPPIGQWFHLAFTRNIAGGAGNLGAMYVMGNRVDCLVDSLITTCTGSAGQGSTAAPLRFNAWSANGVLGQMGDIELCDWYWYRDQSLSAAQIRQMLLGNPPAGYARHWPHESGFDGSVPLFGEALYRRRSELPRGLFELWHFIGDSNIEGQSEDTRIGSQAEAGSLFAGGCRTLFANAMIASGRRVVPIAVGGRYKYPATLYSTPHGGWFTAHDGHAGQSIESATVQQVCLDSAGYGSQWRVFRAGTNDAVGLGRTSAQMQASFALRMNDLFTGTAATALILPIPVVAGGWVGQSIADEINAYNAWLASTGVPGQQAGGRDVRFVNDGLALGVGDFQNGDINLHITPQGHAKTAAALVAARFA